LEAVQPPKLDRQCDLRFGTCAWSLEDWQGVFYPEPLPAAQRLAFYAHTFDTVEVDSTFYAAPALQTARSWLASTPENFIFSCKVPREITHVRKLRGCGEMLAHFLDRLAPLQPKLGCLLIQLPPWFNVKQDESAFREFICRLPREFRFAVEFRSDGWNVPRIAHLLEEHEVCRVWNDLTSLEHRDEGAFGFHPRTADFLYVRLIGDLATKYRGDQRPRFQYRKRIWPRDASLESWAVKVRQHLETVSRVFIFANNHFEGFAPATCQILARKLGRTLSLPASAIAGGHRRETGTQLELAL
jgi:uncharacterized protein YecE (DUF72 family)